VFVITGVINVATDIMVGPVYLVSRMITCQQLSDRASYEKETGQKGALVTTVGDWKLVTDSVI
jgi:hypothetical protein